jgi:benzil reductase ((S)-benzoin forming)
MYAEVLAQENTSVPIHAFTPGKLDTPMQAQILAASKEDLPGVEHFREEYADGLLVKPEAVAKAVLHVVQNPGEQPVVFPTSQITIA